MKFPIIKLIYYRTVQKLRWIRICAYSVWHSKEVMRQSGITPAPLPIVIFRVTFAVFLSGLGIAGIYIAQDWIMYTLAAMSIGLGLLMFLVRYLPNKM